MTTNMLVLGVAYQAGLLPLTAAAIEGAVRLNGVAVEQNLQAFRYGRLWGADPDRVRALVEPPASSFETERAAALERLAGRDASAYVSLLDRVGHLDAESRRLLAFRIGELIDYQDVPYAAAYVDFVLVVAAREAAMAPGRQDVTHAVIRNLYKLMAYKDEYEVARLHLKPVLRAGMRGLFAAPRRVSLAPPPAAPPRARPPPEAPAGAVVRAGPPRAPGAPAPAGDRVRSLRVRRGEARGAAPRALVPRARVQPRSTASAPTPTSGRSSWPASPNRSAATKTSSSAPSPKCGSAPPGSDFDF